MHVDDLRESEDMSLNLLDFCGTLISNLLNPETSGKNCTNSNKKCFYVLYANFDRLNSHFYL